ncbi:MAG: hypothetical protein JRC77_03860, partial [Deltaproteobacteria bacterium]|nr:hypothetical protein [Deltaproteobacteria bacterium]
MRTIPTARPLHHPAIALWVCLLSGFIFIHTGQGQLASAEEDFLAPGPYPIATR